MCFCVAELAFSKVQVSNFCEHFDRIPVVSSQAVVHLRKSFVGKPDCFLVVFLLFGSFTSSKKVIDITLESIFKESKVGKRLLGGEQIVDRLGGMSVLVIA